ncbi:MAG TPA: hypothetical protein VFJ59_18495 [Pseudolabrys sp.]|jgi:hypothetical protein|nr:hypothetical protein [Pseudolabrys sp.]
MRPLVRRSVTLLAIYAIALHTVLWATVAPHTVFAAIDPFTVICHSETSAPAEQAPVHGPLAPPAHACDHCNLCSVAAPPLASDTAVTARFQPVRSLRVLHPANIARHDDIAADPKLARGPPAFA